MQQTAQIRPHIVTAMCTRRELKTFNTTNNHLYHNVGPILIRKERLILNFKMFKICLKKEGVSYWCNDNYCIALYKRYIHAVHYTLCIPISVGMKDPFPPLLLNWRRHSTFPDGPMTSAVTSLGSTSPEKYSSLKGTCVEK